MEKKIMCDIEKFFSDDYHYRLRMLAQIKANNFDKSLEEYKKIFLFEFQKILEDIRYYFESEKKEDFNSNYIKFFDLLLKLNIEKVDEFFNSISDIYSSWLNHEWSEALDNFNKLLDKFHLLNKDKNYDISDKMFFRARQSKENLTQWDMFHIPFDRRYLIKNQRFSITGQPLLYLGSSILNTVFELGKNNNDISDLNFSSYYIPEKSDLNIYDLTNNIQSNELFIDGFLNQKDNSIIYEYRDLEYDFFKFILMSICSFKNKFKEGYFCEEYVIPQLLSSTLAKNKFNGIVYPSTRINLNINSINDALDYKYNLVIFTKVNRKHVYDKNLYDKLIISNPIKISIIKEDIINESIKNLYSNIVFNEKNVSKLLNAFYYLDKFRMFKNIIIDKKNIVIDSEDNLKNIFKIEEYLRYIYLLDLIQ